MYNPPDCRMKIREQRLVPAVLGSAEYIDELTTEECVLLSGYALRAMVAAIEADLPEQHFLQGQLTIHQAIRQERLLRSQGR